MENDLEMFLLALDKAVDTVMQTEMADLIRAKMSEYADELVYNAYEPRFYSRRRLSGGIMDPHTMDAKYDGKSRDIKVLEVSANADWQQLWGGEKPNYKLADAIERGISRFNMKKAWKRRFAKPTERFLQTSGLFDSYLEACVEEIMGDKKF